MTRREKIEALVERHAEIKREVMHLMTEDDLNKMELDRLWADEGGEA